MDVQRRKPGEEAHSYEANSQLVSVNFNGTECFYLRNGQTDVVGLMDGNGARVVEYIYDAWGAHLHHRHFGRHVRRG